jgi:hypothetical protein
MNAGTPPLAVGRRVADLAERASAREVQSGGRDGEGAEVGCNRCIAPTLAPVVSGQRQQAVLEEGLVVWTCLRQEIGLIVPVLRGVARRTRMFSSYEAASTSDLAGGARAKRR